MLNVKKLLTKILQDISALNTKTSLTITRTENTHVTATNFGRLYAFKKGNMLFLNGNMAAEYATGFSDLVTIGTIQGWSALSDVYVNVPSQNGGGAVILVAIDTDGTIRIYSSTSFSGAPFFRFHVSVPTY